MKWKTRQRRAVVESFGALLWARLAVALVPVPRLLARAARPPRRPRRFVSPNAIRLVGATVERLGRRPWLNAPCLVRALAAQRMLRRRGVASKLCLGVAREQQALAAHAWIELEETPFVGGGEAARFTRIMSFG